MIINLSPDWRIRDGITPAGRYQWHVETRLSPGRNWFCHGYFDTLSEATMQAVEWQVMSIDGEYGPEAIKPLQTALAAFENNIAGLVKALGDLNS